MEVFIFLTIISSQSRHYTRLSGPRLSNSSILKSRLVVQLPKLPIEAEKVHGCEKHKKTVWAGEPDKQIGTQKQSSHSGTKDHWGTEWMNIMQAEKKSTA